MFVKDEVTWNIGGKKRVCKFTVDPTQKPKWIDFTVKTGDTLRGLYELDGDNLKVSTGKGDKRSTRFQSDKFSVNDELIVMKRAKP